MEVRFKNFVTIRGSYTQQGLSIHITFRPIKSGATVPLNLERYRGMKQRFRDGTVYFVLWIKVFLTIFVWWEKDPDPYLWLTDSDPGGPKSIQIRARIGNTFATNSYFSLTLLACSCMCRHEPVCTCLYLSVQVPWAKHKLLRASDG